MPFVEFKPYEEKKRCRDPEHDPPRHIVLEPGVHIYKCPACGETQRIVVSPRPTL